MDRAYALSIRNIISEYVVELKYIRDIDTLTKVLSVCFSRVLTNNVVYCC